MQRAKLPFHEPSSVVSFYLTLPLFFNPAPGQLQGEAISSELLESVADTLAETFGGVTVEDNRYGVSVYPDPEVAGKRVRYRDYERRFIVDVPISQTAQAFEFYSQWCSLWAQQFKQRELYLKIIMPDAIWIMRFPPSDALSDQAA